MPTHTSAAHSAETSPLGQRLAQYPQHYDAALLYPIPRAASRSRLPQPLVFTGADVWTAFELSWLNTRGRPQVAIAHIVVPCHTPHIIESKSLKLYLNSFNQSTFASADAVRERICADLNAAAWGEQPASSRVLVQLIEPQAWHAQHIQTLEGVLLDRLDIECTHFDAPRPQLLAFDATQPASPAHQRFVTHLFKSHCPVTAQPDWASVCIDYDGQPLNQGALLQYLVSFRNHGGFHEDCVERIFSDIWTRCQPAKLSVYARFTRRGGLDINPWRTSYPAKMPPNIRLARQ